MKHLLKNDEEAMCGAKLKPHGLVVASVEEDVTCDGCLDHMHREAARRERESAHEHGHELRPGETGFGHE